MHKCIYPILKNGTVGRRGFGHGHPDWKYDNKFRLITFGQILSIKNDIVSVQLKGHREILGYETDINNLQLVNDDWWLKIISFEIRNYEDRMKKMVDLIDEIGLDWYPMSERYNKIKYYEGSYGSHDIPNIVDKEVK